jgi:hypothetical protein
VGTFDEKKNGGGKSRATVPLFSFEGIRNSVYTNLHEIPRNSAELKSKKFRGITRNKANSGTSEKTL